MGPPQPRRAAAHGISGGARANHWPHASPERCGSQASTRGSMELSFCHRKVLLEDGLRLRSPTLQRGSQRRAVASIRTGATARAFGSCNFMHGHCLKRQRALFGLSWIRFLSAATGSRWNRSFFLDRHYGLCYSARCQRLDDNPTVRDRAPLLLQPEPQLAIDGFV